MDIESLNIQITADAQKADSAIDNLTSSLTKLSSALSRFGSSSKNFDKISSGLGNASSTVQKLGQAMSGVDGSKLDSAAKSIKTVASATGSLATNLSKFSNENSNFSQMAEGLSNCVAVIKRLGHAIDGLDGAKLHDLASAMNAVSSAGKKLGKTADATSDLGKTLDNSKAQNGFTATGGNTHNAPKKEENVEAPKTDPLGMTEKDRDKMLSQYDSLSKKAATLKDSLVSRGLSGANRAFKTLGDASTKVWDAGVKGMQLVGSGLKNLGQLSLDYARHKLSPITSAFNNIKSSMSGLGDRWNATMARVAKTGAFMLVRKAFTAMIDEMKDQIDSLAQYSDRIGSSFNKQLSSLQAGFTSLSANLASAFEGLLNLVYPILEAIIKAVTAVIQVISQLFAALGGKATFSVPTVSMGNYAKSTEKAAKSTKKANKEAKEYKRTLLGFDEINKLDEQNKDNGSNPSGGSGGGGGVGAPTVTWSQKEINPTIKKIADQMKDWWEQFLKPLKTAWNDMLPYLKQSWKNMCHELSKLLVDVINDFLKVWNEKATVDMLKNILGILGDIMQIIANIAHGIDEAWNFNQNGLKILQNLRDQLAIIVQHIRNVTEYMKEWAKNLDFKPLFASLVNLTDACKKLFEFLGQAFEDFMIDLVLPYIKYLIEEGLPNLNNTIARVINEIPWPKLNEQLDGFFKSVERLLERISEATIGLIGRIGDDIADFFNSPLWDEWAANVQKFIDNIPVEDIFDILGDIAEGVGEVVKNVMEFTNGDTFIEFLNNLKDFIHKVGDSNVIQHLFDVISQAILNIAEGILKFVNSDGFQNFLDGIIDFLSKVTAEQVESVIRGLAIAIGLFKFGEFATDKLSGFFAFIKAIKEIQQYKAIKDQLKTIADALGSGTGGIAAAGKEAGDAIGGMSQTVETVSGQILDAEGNVVGETAAQMSTVQGGFANMFASFVQTVQASGLHEALVGTIGEVGTTLLGVGTIIGGLVGGITSFVSQWQNGASAIKGAIQIISGALVGLGLVIAGVAGWPAILIGAAVAAAAEIVVVIKDHWNEIKEFLAPVGDFFSGIWDGVKSVTSTAWDAISGVITTAWDGVVNVFGPAVELIVGIFTDIWNGVSDVTKTIWTVISRFLSGVWEGISEAAKTIFGGLGQIFSAVWELISTVAKGVWMVFSNWIIGIWNGIVSAAKTIFSPIAKFFSALWTGISNVAKTIWNGVSTFLSGVWNRIKGIASTVFGAIGNVIKLAWVAVLTATKTIWNNIKDWVSSKWQELKDFLLSVDWKKVGYNLVHGLLNGIEEKWKGLVDNVTDKVKGLTQKVKDLFGIHSPSKVFFDIGDYLVQGLGNGVTDNADNVTKAFQDLAGNIEKSFETNIKPLFSADKWKSLVIGMKDGIKQTWDDTVSQWLTDIQTWWTDDVSPWFTAEKWSELASGMKNAIKKIWDETAGQWKSDISSWWDTDVAPWFTAEKWKGIVDNIRTTVKDVWDKTASTWKSDIQSWWQQNVNPWFTKEKWTGIVQNMRTTIADQWNQTVGKWKNDIQSWWSSNVQPWFTNGKWKTVTDGMKTGIKDKWNEFSTLWQNTLLKNWWNNNVQPWFKKDKWNFSGIKEGLSQAWNDAINAVKRIWNNFARWFNDFMTFNIPSVEVFGHHMGGGSVKLGHLPTFATGGFPEDGLFMANHGEMVGQFANGKTAVANNEQIVEGIKQGVTEALMNYMSMQRNNAGNGGGSGDIVLMVDSEEIARAVNKGQRKLDKRYYPAMQY